MKQCRSCKKVYSNKYRCCPHCGSYSRTENVSFFTWLRHNILYILMILLVLFALFVLTVMGSSVTI